MPELAAPTALRFEHHPADDPALGIGIAMPRISWQVAQAPDDYTQTRYEIETTRGDGSVEQHSAASGEQILVPWPGAPLTARESASVRVRVGDATTWSGWSRPAVVEAGLLTPADWTARFITPRDIGGLDEPAPVLSATIDLPGEVTRARLYATAHGLYVAHLNGERVGDEQLAPGWTAYRHRLRYRTHDVTALLRPGPNHLEILLGNGWFRGRLGFRNQRAVYGTRLAALAQLEVTTTDGTVHVLHTDGTWTAHESHIVTDDLYDGQRTDLTRTSPPADPTTAAAGPAAGTPEEPGTTAEPAAGSPEVPGTTAEPAASRPEEPGTTAEPAASRPEEPGTTAEPAAGSPEEPGTTAEPAVPTRAAPASAGRTPVDVIDADLGLLVAPDGPPVRITQVLRAVAVTTSPSGKTLIDFGQNLVGWVRLRVRGGTPGQEVTVRHAEVLENGELGVRPLRTAKATDSYVLAGADETLLEPEFTFHGFRYAEVSGISEMSVEVALTEEGGGARSAGVTTHRTANATAASASASADISVMSEVWTSSAAGVDGTDGGGAVGGAVVVGVEAVVVGSDLRRAGWFSASDGLLERFHENVVWGMRGNFVDVPTDCPQRDERLGWTGDIQVFSPTASFLFDTAGFLRSWLADLAAEQQKDGSVPYVIPDVIRQPGPATAAWGDAATIVPWVLYQRTGDRELLERQLPSMRAWVDRMAALAGERLLWAGGFQFGDWLDPTAPPEDPFRAQADPDVIATAHLARSAQVVALAAGVVGDAGRAREYGELAARTREAFAREYVTAGGRVLSDAPTVYALALQWALLPEPEQRRRAGRRLADLVRGAGFRISTGFVGTPLMTDALADAGEPELAYRLLLQTGCPSWLYSVTMGATTVWERWDSMLPDGRINPGEMTSFNHYALGAVADWLHRRVAGLAPGAPGYRLIDVRPLPDARLTHAAARHLTPYGEASVAWERSGGELRLAVVVPVGATASVRVPGADGAVDVRHGRHEWTVPDTYGEAGVLPAEATIRQLMDHAPSWDRVVAAAREAGIAAGETALAARLSAYLDAPASEVVAAATGGWTSGDADLMRTLLSPGGNS